MAGERFDLPLERPLARYGGERPSAPEWYARAMAMPFEEHRVEVEGASIEVLAWGDRSKPGLLLAHGMRGHARWWGPIPALLAAEHRVVALSFSGMGGSDWREAYSLELGARELFAAAEAGGILDGPARPVFVGHSYGARPMAYAAKDRGQELAGVILVDSKIAPLEHANMDSVAPKARVYPDLASALSRFTLLPPQDCVNDFLLDDVARAGLVACEGGWRWRFDPGIVRKLRFSASWDALATPSCPIAMVYAGRMVHVDHETLAAQREHLPKGTPFVEIPDAGHHVMLDQPIALAVAIRALVWPWQAQAGG
jgi:pimeloyl-ACP methyl ester carboxylesterase